MSKLINITKTMFSKVFVGPGLTHSLFFGSCAGLVAYNGYLLYRVVKLTFFDMETAALQSRKRYFEKQQLYQEELGRDLAAGYIANFIPQYDCVATRLPFQKLDPKYII